MDQNEKQLEKKLRDRIEANYRSYIQQLQSRPAPDLIEQAAEIASVKLVYDELMDCCSAGDAEYLLRFENPLRLVSDQWLAEQNVSHSDELGHALWNITDKGLGEGEYAMLKPAQDGQETAGPVTVREFLEQHPGSCFDMMTPGGFVCLTPEKAALLLSGQSVKGHPGEIEYAMEIPAEELLNQEVLNAGFCDRSWHILSDDVHDMEQQTTDSPDQGGTAMLKLLRSRRGEGYIDTAVMILCVMLVIAVAMSVLPVFVTKNRLDTYASELCREAEIQGCVGTETARRAQVLTEQTGLEPDISWSKTGKIQLNEEFTVTASVRADIGLFGGFGSFPVTLTSKASGKSEVYWK